MSYELFILWLEHKGWPGVVHLNWKDFCDLWDVVPRTARNIGAFRTRTGDSVWGRILYISERAGVTLILSEEQPTRNDEELDASKYDMATELQGYIQ